MITIISDVHGNLEALEAVLQKAGSRAVIYCAGDIVGYGPNPNECCEILRSRGVRAVQGNHDLVCATCGYLDGEGGPLGEKERRLAVTTLAEMNTIAQESCRWTFGVLTEENRRWLRELPLIRREGNATIIHGSPGSDYHKLNTYLQEKFETASSRVGSEGRFGFSEFCRELVEEVKSRVLIVGHTHISCKGYVFRHRFPVYVLPFLNRESWVINPGSVGQPREGWRASFATVKFPLFPYLRVRASFQLLENNVKIYRVPYQRKRTIRKIEEAEGLDDKAKVMLANWI